MKYVIINENKIPQHSLDKTYSFDEVKDYPNLAVLIEEPVVVIDIDNEEEGMALFNIVQDLNINTTIMKTDRGFHFWFKSREPFVNTINSNTPITLKVDVKSWGYKVDGIPKKSLVTVKKDGVWRKWLSQSNDLDLLPYWLTPTKIKKDLFKMEAGEGRNDGLYTYIIPLLKAKFSKEQIRTIFELINKYIFKTPLLPQEIEVMFKNNSIFDETLAFFDKKEFLHHEFAFWMKDNYPIEFYNGQLYVYKDGVYIPDYHGIESLMIRKIPKLKSFQRIEVSKYLELICKGCSKKPEPLWVNTLSGIYDIENQRMLPHSIGIFSINQIPAYYNPAHIDEKVDYFLDSISNNNKEVRALLEEMIGYCLINDCRFQKAFILLGGGANGKSVFLKMLTNFLGESNVCSIPLQELNGKFESSELVDKLANIADDISSEYLNDSSTFKKLVTGDKITAQRKFQNPFQFNNIAKFMFSTNNLPPVSDKSFGLYRRLVIVPFTKIYTPKDPNFNPNILRDLITDSAKMYLLTLGLKGIARVIKSNEFTYPKEVTQILEEYMNENNNCLQWLDTTPDLEEVEVGQAYKSYSIFSLSNGTKPYKKSRFINEVLDKVPTIRLKNTTQNGKFIQVFSTIKKTS